MKNPFSKKAPSQQEAFLRTYLDCIAPGIVKFEVDHYIFGSTYRCVWALREYPASTEAQALLRELGEKSGVTLRIYCRQVSPGEEDRIIDNANKKNKLDGSDPNKLRQAVAAESNLRDVAELVHADKAAPVSGLGHYLRCAIYYPGACLSTCNLRQSTGAIPPHRPGLRKEGHPTYAGAASTCCREEKPLFGNGTLQ